MTAIATEIPAHTTARNAFKNLSPLQKRARAKYLTTALILKLVDVDSPLNKQYWNTYHCSAVIAVQGGKPTARFCKNRFCIVCARNRSAELIKKYNPIIDGWQDKHFLTLTIPNVSAPDLVSTIARMKKQFSNAVRIINYRRKKQGAPALKCLLKTECTYNPETNEYHPHFHVVTDTYHTAQELYLEWIERFTEANPIAQDLKVCDETVAVEMFKYFTKIITKKDSERGVYVDALDTIFRASKGVHTFQTYGFKAPKLDDVDVDVDGIGDDSELLKKVDEISLYSWQQEVGDWIEHRTGNLLSGHVPSKTLIEVAGRMVCEKLEQVGTEKRENYHPPANIHEHPAPPHSLKNQARNVGRMELKRDSVPRNLLKTG